MTLFRSFDPLEAAIGSGRIPATLDTLRALSPAQRHDHRTALLQLGQRLDEARWSSGQKPTTEQSQAHAAALLLCGTAKDVAQLWIDDVLLVALCAEFRPRALDGLADALLERSPQRIRSVQALIAAGLAPRPGSTAYVFGLISLPWVLRDTAKLQAALAADTGLAPALLRVLEVEGTAEVSLSSSDKYNHAPGLAWGTILLGLVESGVTTRAVLLDKTLAALENDWPQYRSGWFSRFHVELAPDAAAMRAHLPRYFALCHSRIPPTVSLALDALARLEADQPLDGADLLEALRPVLAGAVKSQIEAALKLVDSVIQRESGLSAGAAMLVTTGLLVDSVPLQKAILRRLGVWGVDDAVREQLRNLGGGIAAVNREAWQRLTGDDSKAIAVVDAAAAVGPVRIVSPIDPARRLAPIEGIEQLVECIAHVFENDTDIDAFERALAGVVSCGPFIDVQRRALAPALKRAAKVPKPIAMALARLLLAVAEGRELAVAPGVDAGGNRSPAQAVLLRRIDDLIEFAKQGAGVAPLSAPTHERGFIAPAEMVERVAAHQARGVRSSLGEQVLGLLRLAPADDDVTRAQARSLADEPFTRALRYALGDSVAPGPELELFVAAARIRHPDADDELLLRYQGDLGPDTARAARYAWRVHSRDSTHSGQTYHFHDLLVESAAQPLGVSTARLAVLRHLPRGGGRDHYGWWSFGGIDEGSVCWSATLLPSCLEAFFAEGARAVGNNLDWWEAQWQNAAYLRRLLEPTSTLGPMGCLLLALGLLGKEPGQTAIAIDALVQSLADGRLDSAMLGATLRGLFATPMPKATRLRSSLLAATRADASIRHAVFDVLADVLTVAPSPREVATLMELLLELKLGLGLPLPPATREALAKARYAGRTKALQKDLLA